MLNTNERNLVKMSVVGEVSNPGFGPQPYRISAITGKPLVLPGTGGITYNIRVGDSAIHWAADHVEPGVSIKNTIKVDGASIANNALNVLSCIGNKATVVSGDAKGKTGTVTGKHGGIEHVLVDFDYKIMEKLVPGDKILVRSFGTGLTLSDYPDVFIVNMDPLMLKSMGIKETHGKLEVPVSHIVPSAIMGSGLGYSHTHSGDYDIQFFDEDMRKKHNMDSLRLGDIVAITDADHTYGRIFKKGVTVIGIVVHCKSVVAGHGPGVTTLMISKKIVPVVKKRANIASILKLRKGF